LVIAQVESEPVDSSAGFFNAKTISLLAVSSIYVASLIDSYIIWWRDDTRPFTVMNSSWYNTYEEMGVDKLGHFFTSYFFFRFQKDIFLLGGYSDGAADLLSGSLTLAMALIIEVGDGYSQYGFDPKDLIANMGGLSYAWLQGKVPFLNNFNFKWSYFPVDGWQFPPKFSKHYDGHIYWLAFNVTGLFPSTVGKVWPAFLQPAVGYSVGANATRREFMIGLDLDLYYFLKSDNEYVDFAGKTLNMFHVPMPGIKIYEHQPPDFKLLLLN
jgi:hypothetical protein